MISEKRALLLIGSPRGNRSNSYSLGSHLLEQLKERGWETNDQQIQKSLKTQDDKNTLLSQVDSADIIILAFPLYVDTLPAPVIETMNLLLKHFKSSEKTKEHKLIAIINSGFPEPEHNDIALTNCKIFSLESGIEWGGGLRIGGGAAIGGRPLEEFKGIARKVIKALDLTAEALSCGKPVPNNAIELTSKPFVPKRLYLLAGSRRWKANAKKNGVNKMMYDTPYK